MLIEAVITCVAAIVIGVLIAFISRNRLSALGAHRWIGITGLVLSVAGTALIVFAFSRFEQARVRASWPGVEATVTGSEITGNRVNNPRITYEYQVQGRTYEGVSRVGAPGFGGKHKRLEVAEAITEKYPAGSALEVRYDPDNPAFSLVVVRASWAAYMKLSVGVFVLVGGVFLLAGFLSAPKTTQT